MKTLLVALYPYNAQGLDSWHDHGVGMAYIAAKTAGYDIDFLDMKTLSNDSDLEKAVKGYDLIAFGLKSSYYSIGMNVIKYAKAAGAKVLVAGYHVTAAPQELLENPNIDWVFHGESELTFPQFLKSPETFPREIWGEKPPNLDLLPFIDHSIFREPLENCLGWWHGGQRKWMTSVISARGCPFKCGFCQPLEDNHFGKKLRRRSVDSVIAELKILKETYHPDCVMIHDDTFLVQPKWIEEFIEKYPQIDLPFWAAGRSDGICEHPELVDKLVKVGWELISVGFESGSQRILDKMKKGITVEQNLESARIIKKTGAKIYGNYMIGLPWETKEDIQSTMKMVDKINAEMPSWSYFTPYPGCELGEECIKDGLSLLDRSSYDRCPYGQKVKNVDYAYVNSSLGGLRETFNQNFCDIIIPTYNNEKYTVDCLESIRKFTKEGSYRIIWVDNGSKDTTLVGAAIKDMKHISIKLPKNLGFTDAINEGLKVSIAPTVCLLNNDTLLSDKWLEKLTSTLYKDPKLGILGPLTESVTEKGAISHYGLHPSLNPLPKPSKITTLAGMNEFLESHYKGKTTTVIFVAFYCALIKREVIDKLGPLDPNFVMGMWDDNDYNMAARKAGYKTELALDTCIYHYGRATFNVIEKTEGFNVGALVKTNYEYLDKKWRLSKVTDTIIISRAIYDSLGDKPGLGILTDARLELMQKYFINSLCNQTDLGFTLYIVLGNRSNEATSKIESLCYGNLDIRFIYTDGDLSRWRRSNRGLIHSGKELDDGCPEVLAKECRHPLTKNMARLDTDDWVAPGWIAHIKYMSNSIKESHFLINYQVIGQDKDGRLYQSFQPYGQANTSPFLVLVQKADPRISPYETHHLRMGSKFSSVYTIPPSYVFMVIHNENRVNKVYPLDKFFDGVHEYAPQAKAQPAMVVMPASKTVTKIVIFAHDSWKDRIAAAKVCSKNEQLGVRE